MCNSINDFSDLRWLRRDSNLSIESKFEEWIKFVHYFLMLPRGSLSKKKGSKAAPYQNIKKNQHLMFYVAILLSLKFL